MTEIVIGLLIIICSAFVIVAILFFRTFTSGSAERSAPTIGDVNKLKGQAGEAAVTRILRELPAADYEIFTTVILPKQADRSRVEMDHVVLSRFGIFVVETKRWPGHVDGGEHGDWLQTIGRRFHNHPNPNAQNDRQVRRLRTHIDIAPTAIRGIVCFVGDTELGQNVPANVVRGTSLLTYIAGFRAEQLNDEGLEHYRDKLSRLARSHR